MNTDAEYEYLDRMFRENQEFEYLEKMFGGQNNQPAQPAQPRPQAQELFSGHTPHAESPINVSSPAMKEPDIDLSAAAFGAAPTGRITPTGGTWMSRFSVGAAGRPEAKLARAQAFYPQAKLSEDGEVLIPDEGGGYQRLNPKGFDFGDLFGAGREIAGTVGGILGGAATANPFTAIPVGAAAGTAASQGADLLANTLARSYAATHGNPIPKMQDISDVAKDSAEEFALGTLGGAGIYGLGKGIKALTNAKIVPELADAYKRLGIEPQLPSQISNGKLTPMLENQVSNLFGGQKITEAARRTLENNDIALENIANRLAGKGAVPTTREELGKHLVDSVQRGHDANSAAWVKAMEDIGEDSFMHAKSKGTNTLNVFNNIIEKTDGGTKQNAIDALQGVLKGVAGDITKDRLTYGSLNHVRKVLKDGMKDSQGLARLGVDGQTAEALRKAMFDDMEEAVPAAVRDKWINARVAYADKSKALKLISDALGAKNNDALATGGHIMQPSKMSSEVVGALKKYLNSEDFDRLRAGMARLVGQARGGQGEEGIATAGNIMSNLGAGRTAFSPEAQSALWGDAMNDLKTIAQQQVKNAKLYNHSNTENQGALWRQINSLGKGIQAPVMAGGAWSMNPLATLAPLAGPWALSRALLSSMKPQSAWSKKILERILPTGTVIATQSAVRSGQPKNRNRNRK